ncbi:uncharacterized [Tachysurus ichikawai]
MGWPGVSGMGRHLPPLKQHGSIWPGYELIRQRIKTKARSHRATLWPPKDLCTKTLKGYPAFLISTADALLCFEQLKVAVDSLLLMCGYELRTAALDPQ